MYFILLVKTRNLSRNGSSQGIKKEEATMRDKSVETLPWNVPSPVYPNPFPTKSMLYFGPVSLCFTSDNIDSGGEGIYGI